MTTNSNHSSSLMGINESKDTKKIEDLQQFSFFKSPIKNIIPNCNISLKDAFNLIKSNRYESVTCELRSVKSEIEFKDIKASKLDYVTFSGVFSKRSNDGLIHHSHLICIDIDNIDNAIQVKKILIELLPPSLMFFSPSGNGIKVIYKIALEQAEHLQYYIALEQFFKQEMEVIIDDKCKDIPRACFLCYDGGAYYNKEALTLDNSFIDTFQPEQEKIQQNKTITDYDIIIDNLKTWLNKQQSFTNGNRNNYVTQLAGAYNRYGIPQQIAENDFLLNFTQSDFTANEIKATVKSIYNNTSFHNIASFEITKPYEFEATKVEVKKVEPTPLLPIEGFPEYIQSFINEYTSVYNVPRDYIAASVLFATALAIGNKLELKGKYNNVPLLWLAIVGNVSSGKTEPLKTCLSYFTNQDSTAFKDYQLKNIEYKAYEKLNKKAEENTEAVEQPFYFQYLLNDYTPEALYNAHTINNRGICIYRDELKGWLDDFGRYAKSGEQSTMLSTFYRQPIQINRASKEPINIEKPCIFISGGIQPEILKDLAKDSRAENGFLSRIMFAYPDLEQKQYYSNEKLNSDTLNNYYKYLAALTNIKEVQNFTLSDDAETIYSNWFNKNVDETNKEPKGYLKGVYGKLDVISLRLAIVVQGMDLVCNQNTTTEITAQSMQTAIEITEYFRSTALKVYRKIFIDNAPSLNKKDVIKYLGKLGASQNEIAKAVKVSQQYVQKVLQNK